MKISFFCVILLLVSVKTNDKCLNEGSRSYPEYQLVKKCQRSKLSVAAKENYAKLSSCKRFAVDKRALSLNFSPRKLNTNKRQHLDYTCEVLQCTEVSGGLYLTNNSRYDYYSVFENPLPVNSTCIAGIGMFYLITNGINYTEAEVMCRNKSSVLADVASERRTDSLALLLADADANFAYVGLKRANGEFMGPKSDGLECTPYRAWAPGHPKKHGKADCMVITRNRTWRSVSCEERLPALCELLPGIS